MLHFQSKLFWIIIWREIIILTRFIGMISSTMFKSVIVDGWMNGSCQYRHIIVAWVARVVGLSLSSLDLLHHYHCTYTSIKSLNQRFIWEQIIDRLCHDEFENTLTFAISAEECQLWLVEDLQCHDQSSCKVVVRAQSSYGFLQNVGRILWYIKNHQFKWMRNMNQKDM